MSTAMAGAAATSARRHGRAHFDRGSGPGRGQPDRFV